KHTGALTQKRGQIGDMLQEMPAVNLRHIPVWNFPRHIQRVSDDIDVGAWKTIDADEALACAARTAAQLDLRALLHHWRPLTPASARRKLAPRSTDLPGRHACKMMAGTRSPAYAGSSMGTEWRSTARRQNNPAANSTPPNTVSTIKAANSART